MQAGSASHAQAAIPKGLRSGASTPEAGQSHTSMSAAQANATNCSQQHSSPNNIETLRLMGDLPNWQCPEPAMAADELQPFLLSGT